ncbi:MAG: 50S ribosomal protein L28 [Chloroflexota bacterium]|nr:50S ribosomal protein L28 [Chloroflexota bacterium]PLS78554.1 MAG: 50S ribosomal protein L28 [Chloroflexota bacterium]
MAKCANCGKGPSFGNAVSFSQRHTRRRFNPNLQTVTVVKEGKSTKVKICTRCIRTAAKTR